MLTTSTPTIRPPPRLKRFGGFPITGRIAVEWASHIYRGEALNDRNTYLIRKYILRKFQQYGINFLQVGESGVDWMVVT